ncbi:MAG: WD40 repeat domain-containing protein [Cytophagales bacterium]|nr:WD40 repeat domain-containing protein [Cytophagales bacterium]
MDVKRFSLLTGHRDCVYALEEIPKLPVFFSGSGDGMIVQWDMGQTEGEQIARMDASVYALCYPPGGGLLLAGHNYEGLHALDWQARKEVASLKLTTAAIFDIRIYEGMVLVACGDGTVSVVDLAKWALHTRIIGGEKSARSIAVNPVAGEIAVGYSDNFIRIFRAGDYSLKAEFPAHDSSVFTVQYSPDMKWLFSGSRDARLKVWNVEENYRLRQEIVAHMYAINDIRFSPDGKHFVTCSMDKSVKVWRTTDLTLLKVIDKARHAGHGTSVNKLLWSSYNNQVVSASDDRTISIWDVIF